MTEGPGSRPDSSPGGRSGDRKSDDAYRTISEVAADLDLPQHVLRFWETRFPQVRPLKRAGGRRFYRPEDVALLRAIRVLLYDEGYTIKGVQRLLAEHGARQVADALTRSLARPRDAQPKMVEGRRGETGPAAPLDAPRQGPAARSGPPAAPAGPAAPGRPERGALEAVALEAGAPAMAGVVDRLSAALADLAECARLLASLRAT